MGHGRLAMRRLEHIEPGTLLHLTHKRSGHTVSLVAEPQQHRGVLLALPRRPYHRLHVATQRQPPTVLFKYSKGHAAALWHVYCCGADGNGECNEQLVVVRPAYHDVSHLYLSLGTDGGTSSWALEAAECVWCLCVDHGDGCEQLGCDHGFVEWQQCSCSVWDGDGCGGIGRFRPCGR